METTQINQEQNTQSKDQNQVNSPKVDKNTNSQQNNKSEKLLKIMFPWQSFYDEQFERYYYFNPITEESVWDLPNNIIDKIDKFLQNEQENNIDIQQNIQQQQNINQQKQAQQQEIIDSLVQREEFDPTEIKNMDRYLDIEKTENQEKYYDENLIHLMKRPARKQADAPKNADVAYTQGGLDYNIWYNKQQTENREKVITRERATTRLDPDLDTGYTKADLYEKFSSTFCFHFARGQCCEGEQCKYYHRVPSFHECLQIDNSRDIFGRPRFATQRDDMRGIGSFMNETRTLMITDFKLPRIGAEGQKLMYEIIYRHFSMYGQIEDINIKGSKGWAFIRFRHRCMAEFAKECMMNQALDNNEMIMVKWAADDDKNQIEIDRRNKEEQQMVREAIEKKIREQEILEHNERIQAEREKVIQEKLRQQENEKKQQEVQENLEKFASILDQIDNQGDEQEDQEENNLNKDQ